MSTTLLCLFVMHAAANEASLDALAWMSGSWAGQASSTDTTEMEELWLAPKGGLMLGLHRDVKNGKAVNFELMRIEIQGGVPVLTSIPQGQKSTPFRLQSVQGKKAVFENPEHDFPQRIVYWSTRPTELCARIEGPDPASPAKVAFAQWCWRKGPA